ALPGSGAFLTSVGVLLDDLDRPEEALPYLRAAVAGAPDSATFRRNLIPVLLRLSEPAEALTLCSELSARTPHDQQLIAHRAMALRMLRDPGYALLHDYERLVRVYRPAAPEGFASIETFNAAFAAEVLRLHDSEHRPLDQSLRGGTQTDRSLPRDNRVIAGFFAMIDAPIRDYVARLDGSAHHPTDCRKASGYRISGSWSVRLQPGGFHINHVHPMGWLSSAYYIELPADEGGDESRAGWLKFGEPGTPLPHCAADHFIRPEAGMLVLFPSYMWHGTVAFHTGGHRLTAAFDVVPD
ncbi:MAG TPA: putative 2OG-Fe(II) oxygenase, partial [Povalibacter sp.]|nr:putative 2OG-Fe(II) oxygenase [Povalibacter sp.]